MKTAYIKRETGEQIDQWSPAPSLQVGDTVPNYQRKPSAGELRWRVTAVHHDYREGTVTYTVVKA